MTLGVRHTPRALPLALVLALATCDDTTGPPNNLALTLVSGDRQFALPGEQVEEELVVLVNYATTTDPVRNTVINWQVVAGAGAQVEPQASTTDMTGRARTRVRLGHAAGDYVIEATTDRLRGRPAKYTLKAVAAPAIESVAPVSARVGDTVTVRGSDFGTSLQDNSVLFDGIPGVVVSGDATMLRAIVPGCVQTRTAQVQVALGAVLSAPSGLSVQGDGGEPLQLEVGHVARLPGGACVRLPEAADGAAYLIVAQNPAVQPDRVLSFRLVGLTGRVTAPPEPIVEARPMPTASERAASFFRAREQEIARMGIVGPGVAPRATPAPPPTVGQRRTFNVVARDLRNRRVTATARAVGRYGAIYQDDAAPAGGYTDADFEALSRLFDDPIYLTDIDVFGAASDVDRNERIIVLLTPVVNEWTEPDEQGFVAGFFDACDLVSPSSALACGGGNYSEIFYAAVADTQGVHGKRHLPSNLMKSIPAVLAHELQHMIHFHQRVVVRGRGAETRWLSEALAHMAEDTVAGVFAARGDDATARQFRAENYERAVRYLRDATAASPIDFQTGGSLEERGAAWLLVKYLAGRFGGNVLRDLELSDLTGVPNVAGVSRLEWPTLIQDWAIALWADDAPQLAETALQPHFRFEGLSLREALRLSGGGYPLAPQELGSADFSLAGVLPPTSGAYAIVGTGPQSASYNLRLVSRSRSGATDPPQPQIAVLRLR